MLKRKAIGGVCALLALALPTIASVQPAPEDVVPPLDAPATAPPEDQDETPDAEERQREQPFFLPPEAATVRSFPDAAPVLRSSVLFPQGSAQGLGEPSELLRVGEFAIRPSARVGAAYDDFKKKGEDHDRQITTALSGGLRAQSLFARHSLGFSLDTTVNPIDRDEGEALFDWVFGANGRLDLTRHSSLTAGLTFTRGTESEESPEALEARQETTATSVAGTVAYNRQHRRLNWGVGGGVNRFTASDDDAAPLTPDEGDNVDERDRMGYNVFVDGEYELGRQTSVFGDLRYDLNDFEADEDAASRDSQIISSLAGVRRDLGQTFSVDVGVGVSQIFFEDPERDDTQAFNGALNLNGVIDLNRVTSLGLTLSNTTGVTTVEDAALVTKTALRSSLNRQLTRTSRAILSLGYTRSDFLDTARTDDDIVVQVAYSRTLTRHTALTASYRYSQRFSDEEDDEFYRNVVSLGLSASF